MATLTVQGSELTTFRTFNQWRERSSILRLHKRVVCIDREGNDLRSDYDFEYARDNDLFPVVAFLLSGPSHD